MGENLEQSEECLFKSNHQISVRMWALESFNMFYFHPAFPGFMVVLKTNNLVIVLKEQAA